MNRWTVLLIAALSAGCVDYSPLNVLSDEPTEVETGDEHSCGAAYSEPQWTVIRRLDFIGLDENGATRGLDLDDRVSDIRDEGACKQPDYSSPEGVPGIDNQFARLIPALSLVGGDEAVESAIQRAINTGSVMLAVGRDRVASTGDDACLTVHIGRATGVPSIGADGLIETGQTIDFDHEAPQYTLEDATRLDGWYQAEGLELEVPMQIDQYEFLVTIRRATIRFVEHEDGRLEGFIAGAIVVSEFLQILEDIEDGTSLLGAIGSALTRFADLEPNAEGECEQLSVTPGFEAAPVYFFD